MADGVQVDSSGCLIFLGRNSTNLVLPASKWLVCFAASLFDGHAVAVEYWKGEITETGITTTVARLDSGQEKRKSKERGKVTKSLRYDVFKRDCFRCQACGAKAGSEGVELHIDHIVPISKGGETKLDNLQTLCSACNLGKSDKI